MATCRSCGRELREDVWTCGLCGQPVSAAGTSGETAQADMWEPSALPAGYQPEYAELPAPSVRGRRGREGRAALFAVGAGLAMVIAIVAVWFFALRGGEGGDAFIGMWRSTGTDATRVTVSRTDGELVLTIADQSGTAVGPFKTDLDEDRLTTALELQGESDTDKLAAEMLTAILDAAFEDFEMVFTRNPADDTLALSVEGTPKVGGLPAGSVWGRPVTLTRVP